MDFINTCLKTTQYLLIAATAPLVVITAITIPFVAFSPNLTTQQATKYLDEKARDLELNYKLRLQVAENGFPMGEQGSALKHPNRKDCIIAVSRNSLNKFVLAHETAHCTAHYATLPLGGKTIDETIKKEDTRPDNFFKAFYKTMIIQEPQANLYALTGIEAIINK